MMAEVFRVDGACANAVCGRVRWARSKSLWNSAMFLGAVCALSIHISFLALLACFVLTAVTLLLGHSVGMHRGLIHRSFSISAWLERCLIYLGVLVGVAGPFGILRTHDIRDWAQRQPQCHDYFAHRRNLLLDLFWQLHCRFEFANAPRFNVEPRLKNARFYVWLERTWMLQQLPLATALFYLGNYVESNGVAWLLSGICLRIVVSSVGHWTVTYFAHQPDLAGKQKSFHVRGAAVQARNVFGPNRFLMGLVSMGECWHDNHHAFPESARIGLSPRQLDPAWAVIRLLARFGLIWNVGAPRVMRLQEDLFYLGNVAQARSNEFIRLTEVAPNRAHGQ
jgi:fatty-acid desaturase